MKLQAALDEFLLAGRADGLAAATLRWYTASGIISRGRICKTAVIWRRWRGYWDIRTSTLPPIFTPYLLKMN